jgi:opacity protein-like surface antigen
VEVLVMTRAILFFAFTILVLSVPPAHGAWLVDANAGAGIPTGDLGDLFGTGLLVGASVGYLSSPFEIGVDVSWLQNDMSGDWEEELSSIGAEDEVQFFQYGVHARWMSPNQSSLSPYLGVGLGGYNIKESYQEPGLTDEPSETVLGVNLRGGVNYWINQALGIGADLSYHVAWLDEDETGFPEEFGSTAQFIGVALGLRWRMSSSY